MSSALEGEGLDVSHVRKEHGDTAVTSMDLNGTDRVHGEYIEGVLEHMRFLDTDIDFAAGHDLVHTALWGKAEDIVATIKERGTIVSFDFADRLDHPLVDRLLHCVDLGFFSYTERDAYIEKFLRHKVDNGMKIAIATLGAKGSLAWDGSSFAYCRAMPCSVVNTVGAGDSFIAGFLCGFLKGFSVDKALRLGAQTAARIIGMFEPWQPKDNSKSKGVQKNNVGA